MDLKHIENLEHSLTAKVEDSMTASAVGSGGVEVLSTPSMILMMEQAARDAVQEALPSGYTTVGIRVDIRHLAATPAGLSVTVTARVSEVDGRRISFSVEARDRGGIVGKGEHERFAVDLEEFMKNTEERISRNGLDQNG